MVDAYAFGMVLHEMMCHEPPWNGVRSSEVYALVASGKRPEVPRNVDPEAAPEGWCKLLRACSAQNAQDRPEFDTMQPMLTAMTVKPNQSTCVVNMQSAVSIQRADDSLLGGHHGQQWQPHDAECLYPIPSCNCLQCTMGSFEIRSEKDRLFHRLVD